MTGILPLLTQRPAVYRLPIRMRPNYSGTAKRVLRGEDFLRQIVRFRVCGREIETRRHVSAQPLTNR